MNNIASLLMNPTVVQLIGAAQKFNINIMKPRSIVKAMPRVAKVMGPMAGVGAAAVVASRYYASNDIGGQVDEYEIAADALAHLNKYYPFEWPSFARSKGIVVPPNARQIAEDLVVNMMEDVAYMVSVSCRGMNAGIEGKNVKEEARRRRIEDPIDKRKLYESKKRFDTGVTVLSATVSNSFKEKYVDTLRTAVECINSNAQTQAMLEDIGSSL